MNGKRPTLNAERPTSKSEGATAVAVSAATLTNRFSELSVGRWTFGVGRLLSKERN